MKRISILENKRKKLIEQVYNLKAKSYTLDKYIEDMFNGVKEETKTKLLNDLKWLQEIALLFNYSKEFLDPKTRFGNLFQTTRIPNSALMLIIQDILMNYFIINEEDFKYKTEICQSLARQVIKEPLLRKNFERSEYYAHYFKCICPLNEPKLDFIKLYGDVTEIKTINRPSSSIFASNSRLRSFFESDKSLIKETTQMNEKVTLIQTNIICRYTLNNSIEIYDRETKKWKRIILNDIDQIEEKICTRERIKFYHNDELVKEIQEKLQTKDPLESIESRLNKITISDQNYARINRLVRRVLERDRPMILKLCYLTILKCENLDDRFHVCYSLLTKDSEFDIGILESEKIESVQTMKGTYRSYITGNMIIFKEDVVKYKMSMNLIPIEKNMDLRLVTYEAYMDRAGIILSVNFQAEKGLYLKKIKEPRFGDQCKTIENSKVIYKHYGQKKIIENPVGLSKVNIEGSWFQEENELDLDIFIPFYTETSLKYKDIQFESVIAHTEEHYYFSRLYLAMRNWISTVIPVERTDYKIQFIMNKIPMITVKGYNTQFNYSLLPTIDTVEYRDRKYLVYRIGNQYLLYSYDISILVPKITINNQPTKVEISSLLNFNNSNKQIQFLYLAAQIDFPLNELLIFIKNDEHKKKVSLYKDIYNDPIHFVYLAKPLRFIPYDPTSSDNYILPEDFSWEEGMKLNVLIPLEYKKSKIDKILRKINKLDKTKRFDDNEEKKIYNDRISLYLSKDESYIKLHIKLNTDDIFNQHHDLIQFTLETFLGQGEIIIPGSNPRDSLIDIRDEKKVIEIKTSLSKYRIISKLMDETYLGYMKLGCVSDGLVISEDLCDKLEEINLEYEGIDLDFNLIELLQEVNKQYVFYRMSFPQLINFSIRKLVVKNDLMKLVPKLRDVPFERIDYIKDSYIINDEVSHTKSSEEISKEQKMKDIDDIIDSFFDEFGSNVFASTKPINRKTKYINKENIAFKQRENPPDKFKQREETLSNLMDVLDFKIIDKNGFELSLAEDFINDEEDLFTYGNEEWEGEQYVDSDYDSEDPSCW